MPDYIFNTTALSNFAAAGRIALLATRYCDTAYITVEVSDELRADFDHLLDPGESSCLALAISRGLTFVTDDLAARRLATE